MQGSNFVERKPNSVKTGGNAHKIRNSGTEQSPESQDMAITDKLMEPITTFG